MRSSVISRFVVSISRVPVDQFVFRNKIFEMRERRVFAHGHAQNETLPLTIFRDQRDPSVDTARRRDNTRLLSVDVHTAALRDVRARNRTYD